GEGMALADRDRRQRDAVGDVAHRIDLRHAGLRELVDRDRAGFRQLDAGLLEAKAFDVRPAAGREHHLVDDDLLVVGQLDAEAMIDLLDRLDDHLGDDLDAALFELRAQMAANLVVEAAQDVLAAIDQGYVRAEAVEDGGELERDIAAALDQNALRQLLEM